VIYILVYIYNVTLYLCRHFCDPNAILPKSLLKIILFLLYNSEVPVTFDLYLVKVFHNCYQSLNFNI